MIVAFSSLNFSLFCYFFQKVKLVVTGLHDSCVFFLEIGSSEYILERFTVFIRLSARGAYLIFGLSGWALIRGGRLFELGRLLNSHHFQ